MCCLHRICVIHHLERAARVPWDFLDCVWYVVVSFGDVRPDDLYGQACVVVIVVIAILLLPVMVCFGNQYKYTKYTLANTFIRCTKARQFQKMSRLTFAKKRMLRYTCSPDNGHLSITSTSFCLIRGRHREVYGGRLVSITVLYHRLPKIFWVSTRNLK